VPVCKQSVIVIIYGKGLLKARERGYKLKYSSDDPEQPFEYGRKNA